MLAWQVLTASYLPCCPTTISEIFKAALNETHLDYQNIQENSQKYTTCRLLLFSNWFLFHNMHPGQFPLPPLLPDPHLPFTLDSCLPHFRKEQASRRQQSNRTKRVTVRQGKSSCWAGEGNLIGRKESQEQAKKSEIRLLPLLGISQKHQAISHNVYTENLVQTHAGPIRQSLWAHMSPA